MTDEPRSALETRHLFAATLREARLRYGRETGQGDITQKQFATMLGIPGERPEERYRLYENAKREPPLWILAAVRRVTGYSLDDLIAQLPAGRPLGRTVPKTQHHSEPTQSNGPEPPRPTPGGRVAKKPAKADCPPNVLAYPRPA